MYYYINKYFYGTLAETVMSQHCLLQCVIGYTEPAKGHAVKNYLVRTR